MTRMIRAGLALALVPFLHAAPARADGRSVAFCEAFHDGDGKLVILGKGTANAKGTVVKCPFDLVKGQDYIVQAEHDDEFLGRADLIDPAGTVIIPGFVGGVELRAAYSARYRFRLGEIKDIRAEILTDCRAGTETRCTLKPGKPVEGADDAFDDRDAYEVSLVKGRTYTLSMDAGGSPITATLLGRNGKSLASASGGPNHPAVIRYEAKSTGPFYFRTSGGFRYTVRLD